MALTVEPIIQTFQNAKTCEILARMLTIDGYPAIVKSGPVAGEVRHIIATLAPYPHYKTIAQLARMASVLNEAELAALYARAEVVGKDWALPIGMEAEARNAGLKLLELGFTVVFDEPEGDPGDEDAGSTRPDFVHIAPDPFDGWKAPRDL